MERSSPVRIAVVATDEWIRRLLEDFLESAGWEPVALGPRVDGPSLRRIQDCSIVLCDLDLNPSQLEAVCGAGRPVVGFSSSQPLHQVEMPVGVAGSFELPPDWSELRTLIRSVL